MKGSLNTIANIGKTFRFIFCFNPISPSSFKAIFPTQAKAGSSGKVLFTGKKRLFAKKAGQKNTSFILLKPWVREYWQTFHKGCWPLGTLEWNAVEERHYRQKPLVINWIGVFLKHKGTYKFIPVKTNFVTQHFFRTKLPWREGKNGA